MNMLVGLQNALNLKNTLLGELREEEATTSSRKVKFDCQNQIKKLEQEIQSLEQQIRELSGEADNSFSKVTNHNTSTKPEESIPKNSKDSPNDKDEHILIRFIKNPFVQGILAIISLLLAIYTLYNPKKIPINNKTWIIKGKIRYNKNNLPASRIKVEIGQISDETDQDGNFVLKGVEIGADSMLHFVIDNKEFDKNKAQYDDKNKTIDVGNMLISKDTSGNGQGSNTDKITKKIVLLFDEKHEYMFKSTHNGEKLNFNQIELTDEFGDKYKYSIFYDNSNNYFFESKIINNKQYTIRLLNPRERITTDLVQSDVKNNKIILPIF